MSHNNSTKNTTDIGALVDHLFRTQYGKMVSVLTSIFGFQNIEIAEDIVQETLIEAFNRWGYNSVPDSPEAWLMHVAKNKALNVIKKEKNKAKAYAKQLEENIDEVKFDQFFLETEIEDSMLRMFFACCHPIISKEDQIAIILKNLCGFANKEIANALLLGEEAVNKRIYRAKKQIIEKKISFEVPTGKELKKRLDIVCMGLYLLFNEGYNSQHSEDLIRKNLCLEAMRLCRLLTEHFKESNKVLALMALMCFHTARFESRLDNNWAIIILEDQDRSKWDKDLIKTGFYYLSESAKGNELTTYHLEASIAAQHCFAPSFEETNWKFINTLYEKLYELKPTPVIKLNLAIISSKIHGLDHAIKNLEQLQNDKKLSNYYLLYATLGEFNKLLNKKEKAKGYFSKALSLTNSLSEQKFLDQKIDSLKN